MLYTRPSGLGNVTSLAGAGGMSALILLARALPGHPELRSDLRPADALIDGSLDEHRQFFLGFVSLDPRLPDPLKQPGLGQLADSPRRI